MFLFSCFQTTVEAEGVTVIFPDKATVKSERAYVLKFTSINKFRAEYV